MKETTKHIKITKSGKRLKQVSKREIWEAIKQDDFLAEACRQWQPVEIQHNNLYWRK